MGVAGGRADPSDRGALDERTDDGAVDEGERDVGRHRRSSPTAPGRWRRGGMRPHWWRGRPHGATAPARI